VAEIPRFNGVTAEVYKKLEDTGRDLLKAIATYLDLEEDYFEKYVINGNSILRAIHYFPISDPDALSPDAVRAGAHEDINLITLLIGASADGLEVLTKDGEWFPIKAKGEDIVINVGDMLQRLTNNKLKSTTHRVVNPPREKWALPFFYSILFTSKIRHEFGFIRFLHRCRTPESLRRLYRWSIPG
jgi:isopenicillin N synthase-like dioxygenase